MDSQGQTQMIKIRFDIGVVTDAINNNDNIIVWK